MKKLKKKDRRLLIVFVLSLVMVSSCSDDFIDVDPTEENSEDFFNTEADYQNALIGAYDMLQSSFMNVLLGEIASDNTLCGGESATDVPGFQQVDDMIHTPVNTQLRDIWSWMFAGVNRANYILEFQDKLDFEGKDVVLGQARFLRAYYYFELVKWFGDVPLVVDQRILFGQQFEVDRTPKTEVYAQIEEDLIYATSVLPLVQADIGRVTKGAARSLLGKVYLEIGTTARPSHYIGGAPSESQIELLFITDESFDNYDGPTVSFFGASFNPNKYFTKDVYGKLNSSRSAFDSYLSDNEEENTHVLNHVFELTYDSYVALVKHLNKPSRVSLNYPGGIR